MRITACPDNPDIHEPDPCQRGTCPYNTKRDGGKPGCLLRMTEEALTPQERARLLQTNGWVSPTRLARQFSDLGATTNAYFSAKASPAEPTPALSACPDCYHPGNSCVSKSACAERKDAIEEAAMLCSGLTVFQIWNAVLENRAGFLSQALEERLRKLAKTPKKTPKKK